MTTIAVDGLNEDEFRRSIENRLREGQPGVAIERLRGLLAPYAGPGRILPERFLTVDVNDLVLTGWQVLEAAIVRHDRPGRPITAISVAFGWPGEEPPEPDAEGNLRPHIETGYFSDDAFPFSHSARDDLLDGYSIHGCTWAADCIATDNALSLEGIDDLHGALSLLESRLLASEWPDEDELRAGTLGSCLLSALLFQAVSKRIERDGMPRPLCVMAGSNGVYPYFDAPVAGFPEDARKAAEVEDDEPSHAVPGPRYSSLLMTGVPRGRKRAVLVLNESEDETATRIAQLRGMGDASSDLPPAEAPASTPEPLFPDPAIGASPLLAKKHPSDKPWDFRDLLGPRDSGPADSPPEEGGREEVDWDDWGGAPPPLDRRPGDPEAISIWPEPEGRDPAEPVRRDSWDPADWGGTPASAEPHHPEPEPLEPELPEPVDWAEPASPEPQPEAPAAFVEQQWEPVEPVVPEAIDWPADEPAAQETPEPLAWVEPAASEPEPEPQSAAWQEPEPVDWPEVEPVGFDAAPPADSDPAEASEPDATEPVDWPVSVDPESDAPAVRTWQLPDPLEWRRLTPEELDGREPVDWPEEPAPLELTPEAAKTAVDPRQSEPGFDLLEPVLNTSVKLVFDPLPPLDAAGPEAEPIVIPTRDGLEHSWVFGAGWLEEAIAPSEAAPEPVWSSPSLLTRLRAWLGKRR